MDQMRPSLAQKINNMRINFAYGGQWRKPLFALRVAANYLKSYLFPKRRQLKYIDIVVGYKCNMTCQHCFAEEFSRDDAGRISLDDYSRFAREAMKLGVLHFSFQGGEALIYKDLIPIIGRFQPSRNLISVTTNGLTGSLETFRGLRKAGVDIIIFSLDSGIAEEHDRFRNAAGSYDKTLRSIGYARAAGLKVILNTTVSSYNVESAGFMDLVDWAERNRIIVNTIFASPVGAWYGKHEVMLNEKQRESVARLRKKRLHLRRDVDSNFREWGCPAAKEVLYLSPYGDVLICPFIHISFGNVTRESLETIRGRALSYAVFNEFHPRCLTAENMDFVGKIVDKVPSHGKLPIDVARVDRDLKEFSR
jgi:MoaA/NifB/PqqE/SkfB family radical SAM enzyme